MRLSAENFYLQDKTKNEVILNGGKRRVVFHEERKIVEFTGIRPGEPSIIIDLMEATDIIDVLKWCRDNNIAPVLTYNFATSKVEISVSDTQDREWPVISSGIQGDIGILARSDTGYPLLITEKNIVNYINENANIGDIKIFRDKDLGHWLLVFKPEAKMTEIPFYAVPYILGSLNIGAN